MKEAILFTKTVCPKCMLVKSAIENSESGIQVTIKNIDHDAQAMAELESKKFSSVPIMKINGEYEADVTKMLSILNSVE